MDRINLNKLYYFYVVAKEGSVKAASTKLHLTQPTISAQVKQLEEDLWSVTAVGDIVDITEETMLRYGFNLDKVQEQLKSRHLLGS